jgi:hypothetical protein
MRKIVSKIGVPLLYLMAIWYILWSSVKWITPILVYCINKNLVTLFISRRSFCPIVCHFFLQNHNTETNKEASLVQMTDGYYDFLSKVQNVERQNVEIQIVDLKMKTQPM